MGALTTAAVTSRGKSAAAAWVRAIEMTAAIAAAPRRTLPVVIDELAARHRDAPALLSAAECLTYAALARRSNQYARWALRQGIRTGDTVCLVMPNRPEYVAIWLGITRVGGIVALVNPNLTGRSLVHCLNVAAPRHIIAAADLAGPVRAAAHDLIGAPQLWVDGAGDDDRTRSLEIDGFDSGPIDAGHAAPTIEDRALYIYTSGTTGFPKASVVSHYRLLQASCWFAGLLNVRPEDRMYDCLPLFHIAGGVQAIGAMLVAGASVVIRDRFSARKFWHDVVRWDCSLFQYIGELCRYLLHAPPGPYERQHRIRLCCGNGLRGDIWLPFKERFAIPDILEFYGSTEGNVSLANVEGRPGSVGRVPAFLAHRFPAALVKYDPIREAPVRNADGRCVRCAANEVGEAVGRIRTSSSTAGSRFEGYTDEDATERKILRDVFEPGDAWFRTGDLMRQDSERYFYFVDRIGDTFRWKGHNVAASEVSDAICTYPGISDASVYGVTVPGTDGRAGMAAIVAGDTLDLAAFRAHLAARLPEFAQPLFLRVRRTLEITSTFKHTKQALVRDGYDPAETDDAIYFNDRRSQRFVRLDGAMRQQIDSGEVRG